MLNGLGIKFVLVPGTHIQIDRLLAERGWNFSYFIVFPGSDSNSFSIWFYMSKCWGSRFLLVVSEVLDDDDMLSFHPLIACEIK